MKKLSFKLFLLVSILSITCFVKSHAVLAAASGVKLETTIGDVEVYTYNSTCPGVDGDKQTILINKNVEPDTVYFFQHGDGSTRDWTYTCKTFEACDAINSVAKNIMMVAPAMKCYQIPQKSDPTKTYCDPKWSDSYDFACLLNDAQFVIADLNKKFPPSIVIASYSRGGAAITRAFKNSQVSGSPSKILFFDSCYNDCDYFAGLGSGKRGAMYVYRSTKNDSNNNADKNQSGTADLLSISTDNISIMDIDGVHHDVPANCFFDFLKNNKCNGQGTPAGGTNTNVAGSISVSSGHIPFIDEVKIILEKPTPKITIPGLNFSEIKDVNEDGGRFLYIPFLGEYIAAIYKYGVAIASIFAVVMIINAGFGWAISGGESEKINHAKTRIGQAMMGLFLAVASYTLLYMINPNLVEFKSLRIRAIERILWEGDQYQSPPVGSSNLGTLTNLSQIPKNSSSADCGKNLAIIANAYTKITPHICLESCSCAWFVSRVLKDSGCDSSFNHTKADTLRTILMQKGWPEIPLEQATPGDVIFYWDSGKTRISHATVFYKKENGNYYIIDANTDLKACWTEEQKKIAYAQCKGEEAYKASKKADWKDNYPQCVADAGLCAPLEGYKPELCGYCSLLPERGANKNTQPSDACFTRQCIKSQALTDNGIKKGLYSILQNPLK